ncbi:MAG TPA: MBOAT family protein, partial [Spongiibacteraceae bacterium]|nr:MBOAT family protein [Spongiibacteraceae bacterium]
MLFTTTVFIYLFLPVVLAGYFVGGRLFGGTAARLWLTLASLFFYGYWGPKYLLLIAISILFNYFLGALIARSARESIAPQTSARNALLLIGVALNVAALGYFKYSDFLIDTVNVLTDSHLANLNLILPLGISFFTFTQIAYLVDCSKADVEEYSLLNYTLFVTFFPHLIAG